MRIQRRENKIGSLVVDSAIQLHRELGPGLLESVYEIVLADELTRRGLSVQRQVPVSVVYGDRRFEPGFRADLIVDDCVLVELKSTESIAAVHRKQLQTYLRLSGIRLGFLLNFGAALMRDGIVRAVNGLPDG